MTRYLLLSLFFIISSCIPLSFAPKIEDKKIVKAKRFKRDLPVGNGYVMEDPKNADEFYNYINMRYDCGHINVEYNVPFKLENKNYYLFFYERERTTKKINLLPLAIDIALEREGFGPLFNEYVSRSGEWYVILYVRDENLKDCLAEDYKDRDLIISYLDDLREEYLSTNNYLASFLKNN